MSEKLLVFGRELLAARRDAGMTQEAVSERLGCHRSAVGRWEHAEMRPSAQMHAALVHCFPALANYPLPAPQVDRKPAGWVGEHDSASGPVKKPARLNLVEERTAVVEEQLPLPNLECFSDWLAGRSRRILTPSGTVKPVHVRPLVIRLPFALQQALRIYAFTRGAEGVEAILVSAVKAWWRMQPENRHIDALVRLRLGKDGADEDACEATG